MKQWTEKERAEQLVWHQKRDKYVIALDRDGRPVHAPKGCRCRDCAASRADLKRACARREPDYLGPLSLAALTRHLANYEGLTAEERV